eukprot:COSAG02_NODE_2350_length_9082_cov_4.100857_7_plen_189_part_00
MKTTGRSSPSDPGAADKGLYWNSLPFGEFLWDRMGIHLRIYKDSPNSTEFQGMNHTPFFDPKKGVPYQRLSPPSGSDGVYTAVLNRQMASEMERFCSVRPGAWETAELIEDHPSQCRKAKRTRFPYPLPRTLALAAAPVGTQTRTQFRCLIEFWVKKTPCIRKSHGCDDGAAGMVMASMGGGRRTGLE